MTDELSEAGPVAAQRVTARVSRPILEARNLCREIQGKRIVDDVSLAVQPGEVVAIVGPSGAGKSSLLRLLNRLDEPTSGTVSLEGQDYRQIPPRELRRRVGMVLQTPFLFPGTVADNVAFGPRQRGEQVSGPTIDDLLARVGLPGFGNRSVVHLSGGEAQRVSLARTLANSPEVLLLDEPTSALDPHLELEVEELISSILADRKLTCLIITHDMAQAERLAHRAILLVSGRRVADGPVHEIVSREAPVLGIQEGTRRGLADRRNGQ